MKVKGHGKVTNPRTATIVVAIASMFCFTISGAVAIAWAIPDGANAGALIAQLFAALALTIPALVGVAKVVSRQETVASGVDKLRNGEMDAKLRAAVAEVLAPHLVDPNIEPQLVRDRAVRDAVQDEAADR